MKNKKTFVISICIVGIILIAIGLALELNRTTKEAKSDDNNSPKPATIDDKSNQIDGIYESNEISIRLFTIDNVISVSIFDNNKTVVRNLAELNDNNILTIDDSTKVKLIDDDMIEVSSNNEKINGKYKKVSDLLLDDYYSYFYGELKYSNSEYNAHYKKEGFDIYMYHAYDDYIYVKIKHDEFYYKIVDKNNLEFEKDNHISKISIGNDELTIDEIDKIFNDESYIEFNGTYKKEKKLTKEEIIRYIYK